METTLSTINLFPQTKAERKSFAEKTIAMIKDSGEKSVETMIKLKSVEETLSEIRKGIMEVSIEQHELNGDSYEYPNAKSVQKVEAGVRYDYSNCNDDILNDLLKREKSIKNEIKERQTLLKSIKNKLTVVDEIDGTITELYPPVKTSTTTLKITLR